MDKKNQNKRNTPGSPEQLDRYLKVIPVRLWVVLAALIIVLTGSFVFGFFAKVEVTCPGVIVIDNDKCTIYMRVEDAAKVDKGDVVRIHDCGAVGQITDYSLEAIQADSENYGEYFMQIGGFVNGEILATFTADVRHSLGIYSVTVVVGENSSFH